MSLQSNHIELVKLADLAGLGVRAHIFMILIELLEMNIHPTSLHSLLQDIYLQRGRHNRDQKPKPGLRKSSRQSKRIET